jgi:hypothetical protein
MKTRFTAITYIIYSESTSLEARQDGSPLTKEQVELLDATGNPVSCHLLVFTLRVRSLQNFTVLKKRHLKQASGYLAVKRVLRRIY